MNNCYVIIPAGGSGSRFGGNTKKQFLKLGDQTMLDVTLKAFLSLPQIKKIVVCLPEEDLQNESLLKDDRIQYVVGGQTRSASVYRGFTALEGQASDIILVHDAARPIVSKQLIQNIIENTDKYGVALPAIPILDTVKEVDGDQFVTKTVLRDNLRAIQTPQGFLYEKLQKAYSTLPFEDSRFTDEAMLMEELGEKIKIVDGDQNNIKITTPFDLKVVEGLIGKS